MAIENGHPRIFTMQREAIFKDFQGLFGKTLFFKDFQGHLKTIFHFQALSSTFKDPYEPWPAVPASVARGNRDRRKRNY